MLQRGEGIRLTELFYGHRVKIDYLRKYVIAFSGSEYRVPVVFYGCIFRVRLRGREFSERLHLSHSQR